MENKPGIFQGKPALQFNLAQCAPNTDAQGPTARPLSSSFNYPCSETLVDPLLLKVEQRKFTPGLGVHGEVLTQDSGSKITAESALISGQKTSCRWTSGGPGEHGPAFWGRSTLRGSWGGPPCSPIPSCPKESRVFQLGRMAVREWCSTRRVSHGKMMTRPH